MLVDILGSIFFITVGIIIGINYQSMPARRKRHATLVEAREWYLYGRHKMYWFGMRSNETDPALTCLSLREYARIKTAEGSTPES